jgi:hypothetical protein
MAHSGIGYPPPVGGFNGQAAKPPNPPHSNIVKMCTNWNVVFHVDLTLRRDTLLKLAPHIGTR